MPPSILLTGATGPVGRLLVQELIDRGTPSRILVPEASRPHPLAPTPLVEVVKGDLNRPSTIDAVLDGIDRVVLLSPPSLNQVAREGSIIEGVERTGRPIHVVRVSALGAALDDVPLQLARWHAVTEAQLRSTGLPTTILRPHFLMQNLLRAAPSVRADNMLCGAFGHARLSLVDGRDVATVAATVLTTDGHVGHDYRLTGPQALTYSQVAETFSSVLGRPIRYVDMPTETYHEYLVGGGVANWMADDLTMLARSFRNGHTWPVTSNVAILTGHPARTLDQFVRDHADAFAQSPEGSLSDPAFSLPCATAFWPEVEDLFSDSDADVAPHSQFES